MSITVEEAWQSRPAEIGVNASATLVYYAFCSAGETEIAAHLAVVTQAPLFYRSIPAVGSKIKLLAFGAGTWVYQVDCEYSLERQQTQETKPETAEFNTTLTFNLVGGTQHISTALQTSSFVAAGGTAVDVKKVIGLDLKTGQVRGVDVFAPVMDYSYTTQFANSVMTDEFIDDLYDLTGTTNSSTFKRRAAGEVLFKGARGSRRGQDLWEVAFEFARSKNKTGLTVGDISGISKKGWEYLDVMYREDQSQLINGRPIQVPAQVNIHRVFEESDFAKLKIGV